MKKITIAVLMFACVAVVAKAQTPPTSTQIATYGKFLRSATSGDGNYLYMWDEAHMFDDTALVASTDYFIIERALYDSTGVDDPAKITFKTVGNLKRSESIKDLQTYFTKDNIAQMKTYLNISSDRELADYFKNHYSARSFSLFYLFIETRMAIGNAFLDKDVKPNELFFYKVTRVDKNKSRQVWGYSVVQSKVGNYTLPYLKPFVTNVYSSDSLVEITWKLHIDDEHVGDIPIPKSKFLADKEGFVYRMPFPLKTLRGTVTSFQNGKWAKALTMLPTLNAEGDTLTYTYYKKTNKEDAIATFLTLEDEVHNIGRSSDTTFTVALGNKSVPLIYSLRVTDTLNAIRLAWDPLPLKPYYAGIEILRYDSQDNLDSVGTVSPTDTTYMDYAIKIGQHYRYKVKALFLPGLTLSQDAPAEGVGTYTKFSRPLPPYNLVAKSDSGHVQLTWDAIDEPGFFGYFVYRGTSPRKMDLIAGPVKTKEYIDTASALSGRSQYYYAVTNQNLRQDTSAYSNVANIMPAKKIGIPVPGDLSFYYANGRLIVQWKDLKTTDNSVQSYIVQRKRPEDSTFKTITATPVVKSSIIDSNLTAGLGYQYRVCALSVRKDTSAYSEAGVYTLPKKDVDYVRLFFVRNISTGVEVSLPPATYDNRKAYNIYRRKANEAAFTKINTIDANTFSYIDKAAQPGAVYVYAITITEKDDREGSLGKSISVRRTASSGK